MSRSKKVVPLRLSLAVVMALTMNAPALSLAKTAAVRTQAVSKTASQASQRVEDPAIANRMMLNWLTKKEAGATKWMATRDSAHDPAKGGIPDFLDYHIVKPENEIPLSPMTPSEALIASNTKALYDSYFPRNELSSYVGTFIESGNPKVETKRGPYQWDSHDAAGLDEKDINGKYVFETVVDNVVANGIKSIRLGPNLFEIKPGDLSSWNVTEKTDADGNKKTVLGFMDKVEKIWARGATATISVAFFPSLERWKVLKADGTVDESQSFLLNPNWPSDMGTMAADMMKVLNQRADNFEKKNGKRPKVVINPINEPETLAGFNRHFWHGAYANWSSPLMMKYYVPSVINIAKANVAIRRAVEENSRGERILFMHNEAMTPMYYPSHKGPGRFAVSKFMLGDDIILKTPFEGYLQYLTPKHPISEFRAQLAAAAKAGKLDEVGWAFQQFVFGSWNKTEQQQKDALKQLVAEFNGLKKAHLDFAAATHKTVKTDNMLWVDYYYQTEFILNRPIPKLIQQLSANHGALLKTVLDAKDDATLMRMVRSAAKDAEKKLLGVTLLGDEKTPQEVNFAKLLSKEDSALFELLIGVRNEYAPASDPVTTARRAQYKLFGERVARTDELLSLMVANDGAEAKRLLGAETDEQLRAALAQIGRDTSDKGPVVTLGPNDTLRSALNKKDRRILERMFGLTRERLLGFEPNHYARHIRLGIRDGFYKFAMQYVNALRLHAVGVGESGTPFYVFAPLLHDQVMMEYAHVLKSGVYGTQYAFGPALDTRGWAKGPLSLHYADDHEVNPSGMLSLVKGSRGYQIKDRSFKPNEPGWAKTFLGDFFTNLRGN